MNRLMESAKSSIRGRADLTWSFYPWNETPLSSSTLQLLLRYFRRPDSKC